MTKIPKKGFLQMNKDDANIMLDFMHSPSAKILLSTGLSINGDSDIVILNFLQGLPTDMNGDFMSVVARIAVTPTHLKAYIKMMQDALERMEQAKNAIDRG